MSHAHLYKILRRDSMTRMCEVEDTADFGYGDPEYHPCPNEAVWGVVQVTEFGPDEVLICDWHSLNVPVHKEVFMFLNFCDMHGCNQKGVFEHTYPKHTGVVPMRFCDIHSIKNLYSWALGIHGWSGIEINMCEPFVTVTG
jgi:hypothetical protein